MLNKVPSLCMGFPDSSVGKQSACNAGDPGSIPGSGRATGEGKGIHCLYCMCYRFCQMRDGVYPPLWYHTEYFPALKIPSAPPIHPFL